MLHHNVAIRKADLDQFGNRAADPLAEAIRALLYVDGQLELRTG
jgi:hypothetical protein